MSIAPPHPCGNRRCGTLVPRGVRYCDPCQTQRGRTENRERGTAAQRGYGATWVALRGSILERDHHLCRYCANVGLDTEANTVDHVRAKEAGGTDEPSNLASCCRDCHSEKTIQHDGGYGRPLNPIDRVEQFVPRWPAERGLVAA